MTILSKEAWDAGQTVVFPHSLKQEASAEQTFSRASRLSMSDLPTARADAGGALDEGASFSPCPFSLAPWQWKGEEFKIDWRRKQRLEEEKGTRSAQVAKEG